MTTLKYWTVIPLLRQTWGRLVLLWDLDIIRGASGLEWSWSKKYIELGPVHVPLQVHSAQSASLVHMRSGDPHPAVLSLYILPTPTLIFGLASFLSIESGARVAPFHRSNRLEMLEIFQVADKTLYYGEWALASQVTTWRGPGRVSNITQRWGRSRCLLGWTLIIEYPETRSQ